jgi:hypothetical protein
VSTTITPFGTIMQRVVRSTPRAIGGAFAASDGEMVDSYVLGDAFEFAILTAHFGVLAALVRSAFGTLHHGGVEHYIARYAAMDVVLCAVAAGYYAVIAIRRDPDAPADAEPFADVLATLTVATRELLKEMA